MFCIGRLGEFGIFERLHEVLGIERENLPKRLIRQRKATLGVSSCIHAVEEI